MNAAAAVRLNVVVQNPEDLLQHHTQDYVLFNLL